MRVLGAMKYTVNLGEMRPTQTPTNGMRAIFYGFALISAGALLGMVILQFSGAAVWDDAYFFARYADNLLAYGQYSWNPGDDPTYGLTSLVYGMQVLGGRVIYGGDPAAVLWICSVVCGLGALVMLGAVVFQYGDPFRRYRWHAALFAAVTLGFNVPSLSVHFSSGMDTMLSVGYLAAYLYMVKRFAPALSPGKAMVIGILGGLAYFVRPDLLVFTIGIPVCLAVFSKRPLARRQARYALIFTIFALLTQLLIAVQTFDSFVPNAWYVKSLNPYGPGIAEAYGMAAWGQFGLFLLSNWLPLLFIVAAIALNFKHWRKNFSIEDKAILICTALFCGYYLFFVLPVMGYAQRFFYPAWAAVVLLGAKSLVHVLYERPHFGSLQRISIRIQKGASLGAFGLIVLALCLLNRPANLSTRWGAFSNGSVYAELGRNNWPYLERFSRLPNTLQMASTELGILSAMNPNRGIVDLSGLNDPHFARYGFDVERLVKIQAPDLIFLPHPDYTEMRASMLGDPEFQARYEVYSEEKLQSWMGLALRKESPWYHQMKNIVREESDVVN